MGRKYSSNVTEALLDAVDIVSVISEYVQLKKAGSNHKGLCPFHSEKSPSFMVSEQRQLYHCFGCGASGNAIGFIMAHENFDFLDALEFLADKVNFDLSPYLEKENSQYRAPVEKNLYELMRFTAIRYYKHLLKNKSAMDYLTKRNLSIDTIKRFGIGYALDQWDDILKSGNYSNYTSKQMLEVGLIIPRKDNSGYYDRFRNRIMFPIFNVKGKVIGFGGRVMDQSLPKYLNSPENDIFNKSDTLYGLNFAKNEISKSRRLIVVEGYMDVISLYQYGVKNAVATLGTALTERHGQLLKRYADEVILCYDSDAAGKKAAIKGIEVLNKAGLKVKVLTLEEGMDPDDYIKKYGKDQFDMALNNAQYHVDYKINLLKGQYDLSTPDGISEFSSSFIQLIKPLKTDVEKNVFINRISKELNISREALSKDLYGEEYTKRMKYQKKKVKSDIMTDSTPIVREKKKKKRPIDAFEARLLRIALKSSQGFDKIQEVVQIDNLRHQRIKELFEYLKGIYDDNKVFSLEKASEDLDFDALKLLNAVATGMPPVENIDKELESILPKYRIELVTDSIKDLNEKKKIVLFDASLDDDTKRERLNELSQKESVLKSKRAELLNKMSN
eukprot:TRINITY_DN1484_c0_g1_i1.p1 TRINITY_DN1484_c0_g1~~TRINITY_DN1484_c0_g1_i1.p1  ORF type:complete len:615 (-),score=88.24 TRINITY_DN1484_c0_g1_i1:456-2300(-)